MISDIATAPSIYIGDLYLSNMALLLVVLLLILLIALLLYGIPQAIKVVRR